MTKLPDSAEPKVQAAVQPKLDLPVTGVVLTLNEEQNLERCLSSLDGWVRAAVVVDSGSTDGTVEIARRHEAIVIQHPFRSHVQQWRWALNQLPVSTGWVLALDADQRVTPELKAELEDLFRDNAPQLEKIEGLYIKRRQVFRGRWIRHGGYYPKYLLKLFRRDACVMDDLDLVDHHFYVKGPTLKLKHDLIEENYKENDITFWTEKHNRYAVHMAEEQLRRMNAAGPAPIEPRLFGTPDQRVLWFKSVWSRLPLYVRPFLYFTYRYFFRLGLLDGKQGFIFHFLQGFWFRLLVDIKSDEARARVRNSLARGK